MTGLTGIVHSIIQTDIIVCNVMFSITQCEVILTDCLSYSLTSVNKTRFVLMVSISISVAITVWLYNK